MKTMKTMKTIVLHVCLAILLFATGCADNNLAPKDDLDLNEMELELNMKDFGLDKKIPIEGQPLLDFMLTNYDELEELEPEYRITFSQRDSEAYYMISKIEKSTTSNGRTSFEELVTECRTCRSENCVKEALGEAIGDGKEDVDIEYRRNTFSATVCWTKVSEGG
ncbi:MAG: hypothetical protein AAF519_06870 [Bacteroidota bacterium]